MASRFPDLSTINLRSGSQRFRRLEQFVQARYRNTFGRTVKYLARFIPPGGVVLDVRANHGKFAKNFARLHRGSCRVYCFEPLEYNYTLLERVVGRYANVKVLRVALSNAAGEDLLYVPAKGRRRISHGSAHLGDETRDVDFGTSTAHPWPDRCRRRCGAGFGQPVRTSNSSGRFSATSARATRCGPRSRHRSRPTGKVARTG